MPVAVFWQSLWLRVQITSALETPSAQFAFWNDCSFDFSGLRRDQRTVSATKSEKSAFFCSPRAYFAPFSRRGGSPRGGQVFVDLVLRTYLPLGLRTGFRLFETVP